tara:strand:- start:1748 stop:2518 length:771 start_codon:yes stop_codon:yes gene_type:complete
MKKLLTEQGATQAWTCCCNGQSHEIGGIQTHFYANGNTCNSQPGGCANQTLQPNGSSNQIPWNLLNPNSNSGYGQGAGTSFPGTGQLNGQTPIGIWSVNNTFSSTNGGNDFGEPYIWFTQNLMDPNDPSKCLPNPANCRTETPPPPPPPPQHKGCIDPNALNDGECCNGNPNCTPVAHSQQCCKYERIDDPIVNECCKWCQTGPFIGNPPQGCKDWMCTDPQWLAHNCPGIEPIEPKDKDKFLELREEIKRIKELL